MLFRSVFHKGVISRKRRQDLWLRYPLSSLLECYECVSNDEHVSYGNTGAAVPPFCCTFSTAADLRNVLAVANEEGIIMLYDTESRKNPVLTEWLAHDNAVFDIAWVPGEACLVTASGDQTAKLWDVKTREELGAFKGHQCSLKSVAFPRQEKSIFCTGGRDGNIMVWDMRCSKKDGFYKQVKQISGAHNKSDRHAASQMKRRRPAPRGMLPSVDSQQSVTVVLFRDENTLVSAGAVDGTIKMWDLRKSYMVHHHEAMPLQVYPYPGSSTRRLGYSGLTLDSTSTNLFSNCTDDNIYMFNIVGLKTTPVAVFSGHLNSSFYIKSTLSPDDQFLASGSSDHHAHVWKISDPGRSAMTLQGHSQEVTSVMWCPTNFSKITSCSDDNTVRIWRLSRRTDAERSSEEHLVGRAHLTPKLESGLKFSGPVRTSECTPGKSPNWVAPAVVTSPRPAACAPSGGDLPLPTSTPTALSTPGDKACLADGLPLAADSRSSIQTWVSGASCSAPPRKVLGPSLQSSSLVKRRLDTDEDGKPGCGEPCPPAKRSREPEVTGEADAVCGKVEAPYTSTQDNKENRVPATTDWLSAYAQRLRGQESPSRSLSPSGTRKQANRPRVSPVSMKKISAYFQRKLPE